MQLIVLSHGRHFKMNHLQEHLRKHKGLSKTGHEKFDRDGALFIPGFIDVSALEREPEGAGNLIQYRNGKVTNLGPDAVQTSGSLETYGHPSARESYFIAKKKIEETIGKRLNHTYYFDRFYYDGQELKRHADRPACQISVTIHIKSTDGNDWPFYIQSPDGRQLSYVLSPGDAVIYKGTECAHWREPLKTGYDDYYHQIFMHYVLQDGHYVEYSFDVFR